MGNTDRASFQYSWSWLSTRDGAGTFSVVMDLFTAQLPNRRGLAKIVRPLPYFLRGTVRRPPLHPPLALFLLLPAARGRRTPAAGSKEKWRVLPRRIPPPQFRAASFCHRALWSLAREFERASPAEKIVPAAQRSFARPL